MTPGTANTTPRKGLRVIPAEDGSEDRDRAADKRDTAADCRDREAGGRDLRQAIDTAFHGGDDDRKHSDNRHSSFMDRQASGRDRRDAATDRSHAAAARREREDAAK
jgi:hypothetical protein